MDIALEAVGLTVGRGRTPAAGPFDFTLRPGEGLIVTGANGAGKSTLLRTLAGLLPPLSGQVALSGFLASDGEAARSPREIAHYIGHRNAMKPGLGVGRNLDFWRTMFASAGAGIRNVDALSRLGLPDLTALPFGYLSAGQQRRASLARLLVSERPVWILDEPTSALDAESQRLFGTLVADHLGAGGIVIAATHQPLGVDGARTLDLTDGQSPASRKGSARPAIADEDLERAEGWL